MKVKGKFDHYNINVHNLDKSIEFYAKALDLTVHHSVNGPEGAFKLVYLTDRVSPFLLELTWLSDHTEPYELGENETHLCIRVGEDYDKVREFHREMGCICYENHDMGLYFISDPDGYWIEILPQ